MKHVARRWRAGRVFVGGALGALGVACLLGCEARPSTPNLNEQLPETTPGTPSPGPSGKGTSSLDRPSRPEASAPAGLIRVGAQVSAGPAVPLGEILSQPSGFAARRVVVEGQVRRTCTKKGCWMELAAGPDEQAPGCRVTFRDYGFFVPTNAAGSHARLEGNVVVKTLSKAHVDHLEAEGAHFASKAADGTALEVQIVADGVELKRG